MSGRVILLLVLLMCASFAAVLGVIWSAISPTLAARTRTSDLRILREPPSDAEPARQANGTSPTRRDKTLRPSSSRLDGPLAMPPPRQELMPAEEIDLPEDAELEQRARAAADLAARRLDQMEKGLKRQIRLLEESRNRMLDELAGELRGMPPSTAAQNVAVLDDETAAMTLHRLPSRFRRQVMDALEPKRARRLQRRLNSLKDN